MKVIVIGGGPAGMMAAIASAKQGNKVILLEKMKSLGRKLLITGKGRCNITSSLPISEFISNVPGNGKFLYSCFENYNNTDIINFLNKHNVKTKQERGNRIFPESDKSIDVLQAFEKELSIQNVEVKLNCKAIKIETKNGQVTGVICNQYNKEFLVQADKVILATGGKSYPNTGSTGDGYKIAEDLGHTISEIKPSLVPLTVTNNSLAICKNLQGLSLKNVQIKIQDIQNNKIIYTDFGEMIFTHFGVSGPIILSGSAHLLRYKNITKLLKDKQIVLNIDLKPSLDVEKLDARILRDFQKEKNKLFKNSLDELLPQKLIPVIIQLTNIKPDKKVNEITKQERLILVNLLKQFNIYLNGFRPIEEAIITSGGINIKEINPKTMESKLISGLFFAGEIIDVDAYTGGFNLQIAYSTGFTAGK